MSHCTSSAQRRERIIKNEALLFFSPIFSMSAGHLSPGVNSYTSMVADLAWRGNALVSSQGPAQFALTVLT